ncbi:MAG: SufS family cysteine desulfurase [Candidatus Berkiella sp.]
MIKIDSSHFSEQDIISIIEKIPFSYPNVGNSGDLNHFQIADSAHNADIPSTSIINSHAGYASTFNVENIRKDFPILSDLVNGKPLIWLDNAATTQKPKTVIETIQHYYLHENSNIHRGNHTLSLQASEKYEATRKQVAQFIHAGSEDEIVFVRGATEGINLVANSFGKKFIEKGDEVIISLFEHHSNILPWQVMCEEHGAVLRVIPIHENGDLIMEEFAKLLNSRTKLVAITHVSNALGTVVPVNTVVKMAHQYGAYVLIDGAQGIPHFDVNVSAMDCDFYIFSAHKLFGPTGIGVVYGKKPILDQLPPWQVGGGMIKKVTMEHAEYAKAPFKFEAGTGNIASVFGLSAILDYLSSLGMARIAAYEHELINYAISKLSDVPKLKIIGSPLHRAGSIPFVMQDLDTDKIGLYLNEQGIALRTGHHCAQPVMDFYGVKGMARPSLAFYNTREEVDTLVSALEKLSYHFHF